MSSSGVQYLIVERQRLSISRVSSQSTQAPVFQRCSRGVDKRQALLAFVMEKGTILQAATKLMNRLHALAQQESRKTCTVDELRSSYM
jgi:hypothetical protein